MALIRPVVLVFQEFATPTVTPTTPDLNVLVVGPAYHIQDYFQPGTSTYADKADILLSSVYGALEADPTAATPTGADYIHVAEPPNNAPGALLDDASVSVYFDEARVRITSGTHGTTASATPNQFDVSDVVNFTTGATKVVPGDRVVVSDGSHVIARTVYTVDTATRLHFTEDIPGSNFTPGSNQHWYIERQLNDQLIDPSFYTVNGNAISLNGDVTLAVPTQSTKVVSYAKVYVAYRSLRQDLQDLDTVTSESDITTKIGRLDARNPLGVGCFVALQNTTSQVQFYGVTSNDLAGHTDVRDAIASRPDVYAIVPLTADVSVLAMWNNDCIGRATPDETKGLPQRFRVVLGSGTLATTLVVAGPSATGQATQDTGSSPAQKTKLTLPGIDLVAGGVTPGDHVHISADSGGTDRTGTYLVGTVIDATHLELDPSTPLPANETGNATVEIRGADDVAVKIVSGALTGVISANNDDLYLILKDANGTFVSDGVKPGDVIQFPADPTTNDFTGNLQSLVVASVLSESRLEIVNNGQDTSTTQNELPHGVSRLGSVLVPSTATLNYRVQRALTKDEQITNLVALAQSFKSRRTVLVWPDVVDVAGVTGGTSQPGYYLSCAVGGMTAGLPSHQGFTNLGIAGVSEIYHSNTYFNDTQLTDLSNGGWYVFAQQTPTSLPFTIHQLTTDTSTLESGEYSVVKNFDFVSLFFVDILEEFLGVYNVTTDTLVLIRAALNIGGDTLKLRTFAKIGAPLTSFSILDLGVSPTFADRVITHLSVGLPKPLNNVELHLVA